ncbi:unnamed protein product [Ixodes hexagonus]
MWMVLLSTVLGTALVLVLLSLLNGKKYGDRRVRLVPGPRGFPLLGQLSFMKKGFLGPKCAEWAKTHGPVFRIKVGDVNIIVLNDFESIKTFLSKKEVLYRPINLFVLLIVSRKFPAGLATLNGQAWLDNRRICIRVLRDMGFGKKPMEEHIKEESEHLVERLAETNGSAILIQEYLTPSTYNNVAALVFGSRYDFEDPRRKAMVENLEEFTKAIGSGTLIDFFPGWIKAIIMTLPFMRVVAIKNVVRNLSELTSQHVTEHEDTLDDHVNRDFIDGYLRKIKENKNDPASNFNRPYLVGNVVSLFVAGSSSVSSFAHWHMLNCAQSVDTVQRRIQEEIDRVVGRERQPTWEDRHQMPYTVATIWEMYRCKPTVNPPRCVGEDTFFGEYFVPKGTIVMRNVWAVHMSSTLWEHPERFDPSRFLSSDGSKLLDRPDYIIPFSVGKRMCPGETLATVEIFVFLTTLLQKFNVFPEEGRAFKICFKSVTLDDLKDQKLRFVSRVH